MGYRLGNLEEAPEAVRAVARERLEHAAAALLDGDGDAAAVHTARKDLKKTRSLLRLARPGMPRKRYRARNDQLRAIAADLERAREAEALAGAVEGLAEHAAGRVMPEALQDLAFALRAAAPAQDAQERTQRARAAATRLTQAAADVVAWPVDDVDAAALCDGFARAYARGRDALAVAREDPSSELLHEWRKRVKDLWYHARLLRDAAPGTLAPVVEDADVLADRLGDEHDLATLAARLDAADPVVAGVVVEQDALRALLDERRAVLREDAAAIAARLYAEKPRAFRRRIRAAVIPRPPAFPVPGSVADRPAGPR